jgi:hypothetical protein
MQPFLPAYLAGGIHPSSSASSQYALLLPGVVRRARAGPCYHAHGICLAALLGAHTQHRRSSIIIVVYVPASRAVNGATRPGRGRPGRDGAGRGWVGVADGVTGARRGGSGSVRAVAAPVAPRAPCGTRAPFTALPASDKRRAKAQHIVVRGVGANPTEFPKGDIMAKRESKGSADIETDVESAG